MRRLGGPDRAVPGTAVRIDDRLDPFARDRRSNRGKPQDRQRLRWSRVSDGHPPCAIDREVEHVRPAVVAGYIEHPVGS